uniref:hypothetical protein n=1 Tax=Acinetobacter tandoii TaxID=202954 RepID=UPI003F493C47
MIRFIPLALGIFLYATTFSHAEDLETIRAKQFGEQLEAYGKKHEENLQVLLDYAEKENRTQAEDRLFYWTVCNTVTNLERAEKLISDNPDLAQYLDGSMLPSIQENLDFHRYAAKGLDGTDAECKN